MSLVIPEDEYFSLSGYVTTPGYQSLILKGVMLKERGNELYAAPLNPSMFYGNNGQQLTTWRQFISGTGNQQIVYRNPDDPNIPWEGYGWRKVAERPTRGTAQPQRYQPPREVSREPTLTPAILAVMAIAGAGLLWLGTRK